MNASPSPLQSQLRYRAQFSPDLGLVKLSNGQDAHLAGRLPRFGAAVVDGALPFVPALCGVLGTVVTNSATPMLIGVSVAFVFVLIEWVMLAINGQSIGRRLFGVRIAKLDGSPCGFVRGVLLRSFVFGLLNALASLLLPGVLWLVDHCMIYRNDRRALHDFIAGTVVLRA